MSADTAKYSMPMRIMHWLMAILILGMIAIGWYMAGLDRENPAKLPLMLLHKSFGSLLLILFCLRVILRFTNFIPPLPQTIPPIERTFAHLGHIALYVFIGAVVISGYAMSNMSGRGVQMFGIPMPNIFPDNKDLASIIHSAHGILPYILLALVVVHFAAVIKHRFFDKKENDVLKRMI